MSKLPIFCMILLLNNLYEARCDPNNLTTRIVGGYDCSVRLFSFMLSIRETQSMKHFCGGTLITRSFVLTAAHCTQLYEFHPSMVTAVSGTSEFNPEGLQKRTARTIFIHKHYNRTDFANDIAVMHLVEPFIINNMIMTIKLPRAPIQQDLVQVCPEMNVIGWGHRGQWSPDAKISYTYNPVLQCVKIPLMTRTECEEKTTGTLHHSFVCAMGAIGKDICQGDDGGPLFCGDTQYGIVSNGFGCGVNERPGYYTRVDRFLAFIAVATNIPDEPAKKKTSQGVVFFWSTKFIVVFSLFMELI
ncbi:trypsin-like [Coccinella septempunctata]|uniref:trypsin-like n=1 Tax=Coccinella septempunctata TaxID=41139 RepID=UPI001D077B54|nr:trypsin-like [Coccinella septempunctata]